MEIIRTDTGRFLDFFFGGKMMALVAIRVPFVCTHEQCTSSALP